MRGYVLLGGLALALSSEAHSQARIGGVVIDGKAQQRSVPQNLVTSNLQNYLASQLRCTTSAEQQAVFNSINPTLVPLARQIAPRVNTPEYCNPPKAPTRTHGSLFGSPSPRVLSSIPPSSLFGPLDARGSRTLPVIQYDKLNTVFRRDTLTRGSLYDSTREKP